jgi:hypothetical protein
VNILSTTGLVQKYVGEWAREAIGQSSSYAPARCGSVHRRIRTTR